MTLAEATKRLDAINAALSHHATLGMNYFYDMSPKQKLTHTERQKQLESQRDDLQALIREWTRVDNLTRKRRNGTPLNTRSEDQPRLPFNWSELI